MVRGHKGGLLSNQGNDNRPVVFISHHSSEAETARHLKAILDQNGIDGWMAPDDIDPGMSFDDAIVAQIEQSDAVILLFCRRSDQSRHVKRELMLAEDSNRSIFPVRLEDVAAQGLAYWLKDYQWLDWNDGQDGSVETLVGAIRRQIAKRGNAPQTGKTENADETGGAPAVRPPTPARLNSGLQPASRPVLIAVAAAVLAGIAALIWFMVLPPGEQTALEPGSWMFTVDYDDVDLPDAPSQAATLGFLLTNHRLDYTICLSHDQAADPSLEMIRTINSGESGYDCQVTESRFANGNITMRAQCDNPEFDVDEPSRIFVNGTYTRTSSVSELEVRAHHPEFGRLNLTGTVSMQRLGECQ
ncbi:MAG: TIR domain-containing protein [Parasphingopyxis sp.]|uniref:TIR domain-containing protein n=1 Tax=Parasphingopyxis sp. TaxID=1920299 RepID=UPI0032EFDA9E